MSETHIRPGRGGHHFVMCSLGQGVDFPGMIDSGATAVSLSQAVMRKIAAVAGQRLRVPQDLPKNARVHTANGVIWATALPPMTLSVNGVTVPGVRCQVLHSPDTGPAEQQTLIGQSFLSQLPGGYRVEPNGTLVLVA